MMKKQFPKGTQEKIELIDENSFDTISTKADNFASCCGVKKLGLNHHFVPKVA